MCSWHLDSCYSYILTVTINNHQFSPSFRLASRRLLIVTMSIRLYSHFMVSTGVTLDNLPG